MENNPYASPADVAAPPPLERPLFGKLARLSWQLPTGSLVFTIAMNTVFRNIPMLGLVGGLVFTICSILGLLLAVVAFVASYKSAKVRVHAIGGFLVSSLFIALAVGSFFAVNAARDAARRARVRQNLDQLEQGLNELKRSQSPP